MLKGKQPILLLSSTDDKYSKDAELIKTLADDIYGKQGASSNIKHNRYLGGHALAQERFDDIVNWIGKVVSII